MCIGFVRSKEEKGLFTIVKTGGSFMKVKKVLLTHSYRDDVCVRRSGTKYQRRGH